MPSVGQSSSGSGAQTVEVVLAYRCQAVGTGATEALPASKESHESRVETPSGDIIPMPVTTTRRRLMPEIFSRHAG